MNDGNAIILPDAWKYIIDRSHPKKERKIITPSGKKQSTANRNNLNNADRGNDALKTEARHIVQIEVRLKEASGSSDRKKQHPNQWQNQGKQKIFLNLEIRYHQM